MSRVFIYVAILKEEKHHICSFKNKLVKIIINKYLKRQKIKLEEILFATYVKNHKLNF